MKRRANLIATTAGAAFFGAWCWIIATALWALAGGGR